MEVYKSINAVQAAMAKEGIAKGRKNQQQGYQFRGIDDCYAALAPHLAENKLCIVPRFVKRDCVERQTKSGGTLFYVTVEGEFDFVSAVDGSKHTARMFGEAMDSGDKASNKAASAALKYVLLQTFCIPTEGDNDTENHSPAPEPLPPKQNAPEVKPSAKPAAPVVATEKTRAHMAVKLKESGFDEPAVTEYGRKAGILTATELLQEWPLAKCPTTKDEFKKLCDCITDFLNGGEAKPNK